MDNIPAQHRQTPPAAPTPPPKHVVASPVPLTTKQRPATPVRGDSLLSLSAMPGAFPKGGQHKGHLASSAEPDNLPKFSAEHNRSQSPVRLVSEDFHAVQREAEHAGQKERAGENDTGETVTPTLQRSVQPVSAPPVAPEPAAGEAIPPAISLDLSDRRRTALPIPAVTDRPQPAIAPVFAPGITAPLRIESHFGPAPAEKVETLPHAENARSDHLGERPSKKPSLGARLDALLHGMKRPAKTVDARRAVPQPFTLNPAELEARMNALIEEKKLAGSEQSSIYDAPREGTAQPTTEQTEKEQAVPERETMDKHASPAVAIGSSAADGGFAPLPSKLDREFRALAAGDLHPHDELMPKNHSAEAKPSDHGGPTVAIGSPTHGQEVAAVPADLRRDFTALTSRKSFSGGERGRSSVASDSSRHSKSSGRRTPTIAIGARKEGQQFSPIPPKLESRFDALVHRKSISRDENSRPTSTEKDSAAIAIGAKKDGQQFSPLPDKLADAFDELLNRRKSFASETDRSAHSMSPEHVKAASSTSVAIGGRQSNQNFAPVSPKLESRFEALKTKLSPSRKSHDESMGIDPSRAAHSAEASQPPHEALNPRLEKEFSELLDKKPTASAKIKSPDLESSNIGLASDKSLNASVAVDAGEATGEKPVADEDIYAYYIDASPVGAGKERLSLPKDTGTPEPHVRLSPESLKGGEHDKPLRDPHEEHSYAATHGRIEPVKVASASASSSRSVSPSAKKTGSPRAPSPADRKALESKFEEVLSRVSHPTQQISPYPAGSVGRSLSEVGHDEVSAEPDDEVPFVESEETLQKEYLNLMKQKKGVDAPVGEAVTPPRADAEVTAPTATVKPRKSFSLGLLSKRDSSRNVSPRGSPGRSSEALLLAASANPAPRPGSAVKVEERRRPSSTLETRFDSLMKRLRRSSTAESLKEAPTFSSGRSIDARQQEPNRAAPLVTETGAQPSSVDTGSVPMVAPPVARAEMPAQGDAVKTTPAAEAGVTKKRDESGRRRSAASAYREPARGFDLQQSFDNLMRRNPKPAASESSSVPAKSNNWLRKSFDGSSRVRSNNNAGSRTPTHISSSGQAIYDEAYRARRSMDAGNAERPAALAKAEEEDARRAYPVPTPALKKTPLMRAKKSLTDMMSRFKTGSKSAENLTAAAAEGSNAEPAGTAASNLPQIAEPKRSASLDQADTEGSQNDDSDLYVPDPSPLPAAYDAEDEDDDTEDDARPSTFHELPPSEAIQFDPAGYGFSESANGSVSRSASPDGEQEIRIAMMQGCRR
ncbi:hypothetical protein HDU87_003417 [Geranomyces variabilis]|uniref:Uncharacterized protein n=1 Tax=Geranomyces variabilis TaxID=109894 RepID=A0AAD5TJN1_9FUNG|nr:hypothetical protein HDU87_003417 [Geranomyces variabilis]